MEVCQDYYGMPPPPVGFGQPLHLSKGNIVELTRADADLSWWEVIFNPPSLFICTMNHLLSTNTLDTFREKKRRLF